MIVHSYVKLPEGTCKDLGVVGIQFQFDNICWISTKFGFQSHGVILRLIASSEKKKISRNGEFDHGHE